MGKAMTPAWKIVAGITARQAWLAAASHFSHLCDTADFNGEPSDL